MLLSVSFSGCTDYNNDYTQVPNNGGYNTTGEDKIFVYDLPDNGEGVPVSDTYTVNIIQNGKRYSSPTYISYCPGYRQGLENMTANDQYPLNLFRGRSISWTDFSFEGEVQIEVTTLKPELIPLSGNVKILPSRYGVSPEVEEGKIRFTLDKPGQFSVEIGEEGYKNGLMIFADPLEDNAPQKDDETYFYVDHADGAALAAIPQEYTGIYFNPGVHDIGIFEIPSNIKNVYLAGGSYVYGSLRMDGDPDVHIFGRGVLSQGRMNYRQAHCIEAVSGSDRTSIEGITIANNKYFSIRLIGEYNQVEWTKVIGGWTYNADGISAYAHSRISHCFIWANDDNIKCYEDDMDFSDMVCWQLNNGGLIQMNWGNAKCNKAGIHRVDIIHAEWNREEKNRGILSCVGNKYYYDRGGIYVDYYGWSKNWLVEDIVTETSVPLVFMVAPYDYTPITLDGLHLKNWKIIYDKTFSNHIEGPNKNTPIRNLIFESITINGQKLSKDNYKDELRLISSNIDEPLFK